MANFDLPFGVRVAGDDPIDKDRYIAVDIAQRDAIVTNGRAHEGLQCFVDADKKLYIYKNSAWEELGGSGSGDVVDILYEDLETLHNTSALVPGQSYRITNFKTSWNVDSEGEWSGTDAMVAKYVWPTPFEPLIVVANSPTTLQANATSESRPHHLIEYDADFNNAVDGLEAQVYTGRITRRRDPEYRLEAHFDYIGVWNPRYKVTAQEYNVATTYGRGARVQITNALGNGLYVSLSSGNVGNDPDADSDNWMIFRPQGADTTGFHRDYISAAITYYENGGFGFTPDLTEFRLFPTFAFSNDLTKSEGFTGANASERFDDFFVREPNNVFMACANAAVGYGNFGGKLDSGFGNTFVTDAHYGITFEGHGTGVAATNNYLFGAVWYISNFSKGFFYNNYMEGLTFITQLDGVVNNVFVRRGTARNNLTTRGPNALRTLKLESTLWYSSNNIHGNGNGDINLRQCTFKGNTRINNCSNVVLDGTTVTEQIYSSNIDWTGYYTEANGYNDNNIINGQINNCNIKDMANCVIESNLNNVDAKRWKGVTIPANVTLSGVDFQITEWSGLNVWSGNPLSVSNKVVSKRYVGGGTEKLWFEDTDVNGVTNLIELT